MAKKDYFPNNWQQYKDSDDDNFIPHTFDELMSWKVQSWELPSSVCCIVRVHDYNTRKVSEHVYSKPSAARNKIATLMNADCEFTIVDHESVHHIYPCND